MGLLASLLASLLALLLAAFEDDLELDFFAAMADSPLP